MGVCERICWLTVKKIFNYTPRVKISQKKLGATFYDSHCSILLVTFLRTLHITTNGTDNNI